MSYFVHLSTQVIVCTTWKSGSTAYFRWCPLLPQSFMAEEELPLFYDFFGSVTSLHDTDHKQQTGATDNPVKTSSLTEEAEQDLGTSVFDESKAPPDSDSRHSSPKSGWTDMDTSDGLRLYKKSRVERSDENKKGHEAAAIDDLSLTMQPPRLLSSSIHPSLTAQPDFSRVIYKHWDVNASPPAGMFGPGRVSQKGLFTDNTGINNLKDSVAAPLLSIPPADEGSRTGLKGSSVGNLLNRAMGGGPGLSLGQSKKSSRGAGSDATFLASQETAPITRQLTIFYGGQAHVFEDVSIEKAEAIMALAGSTGRSWSTVYSPQPKSSVPLSVMEGLMYDRDGAKGGSKPSSAHYLDNSSGFSTEVRNALSSLLHKGHGHMGDSLTQEQSSQFVKWATDMQMLADHVSGKKFEGKTQDSVKAAELEKEPFV